MKLPLGRTDFSLFNLSLFHTAIIVIDKILPHCYSVDRIVVGVVCFNSCRVIKDGDRER